MKNVFKMLAVTTVMVGMASGVAVAETVCNGSISGTGTNSSNNVTCTDEEYNDVSCVNNFVVVSNNEQGANSGGAFTTGNTTSGDAESGDATNDNNVIVTVGANCTPVAAVATPPTPTPTAPTTTATPSTPRVLGEQVTVKPVGGAGAGAGAGVASNKVAATTGILASAGIVGFGLALRKRALGN